MIKRWYSLSVKKSHNDGSGSYSYNNHIVCWSSLFPEPNIVLDYQLQECKETLADISGDANIEIVSFTKI